MSNPLKTLGKSLLGIAPALASALVPGVGGIVAGSALKAVSGALGQDLGEGEAGAKRLADALSGGLTPEQMAALKKADQEFAARMKELDVDLERVYQEDRASARRMQVKTRSWAAPALAFIIVGAFIATVGGVFALMLLDGAQASSEPAMLTMLGAVIGYVSAKADSIVSFYFGSSEGGNDAQKDLAEAVKGR